MRSARSAWPIARSATLEKPIPTTGSVARAARLGLCQPVRARPSGQRVCGGGQEDPERLAEVERRRDLLFRLSGKYGASLEAVLDTRDEAAAELDLLDTADTDLRGLAARRSAAEAGLRPRRRAL